MPPRPQPGPGIVESCSPERWMAATWELGGRIQSTHLGPGDAKLPRDPVGGGRSAPAAVELPYRRTKTLVPEAELILMCLLLRDAEGLLYRLSRCTPSISHYSTTRLATIDFNLSMLPLVRVVTGSSLPGCQPRLPIVADNTCLHRREVVHQHLSARLAMLATFPRSQEGVRCEV